MSSTARSCFATNNRETNNRRITDLYLIPGHSFKVQTIKRGHHEKVIREQKTSTKRRFSTLFKQQAVERADKDGVAQVAKDLGITPGLIYNWRNSLANQSSEQEEIKLMRAENARLKRELSIAQDDLAF